MENINWRKEIAFAGAAAIVAFFVAAVLRSNGAGKWLTAGTRGVKRDHVLPVEEARLLAERDGLAGEVVQFAA